MCGAATGALSEGRLWLPEMCTVGQGSYATPLCWTSGGHFWGKIGLDPEKVSWLPSETLGTFHLNGLGALEVG